MQSLNVQDLQCSQSHDVVVGLGEAGIVVDRSQVFKRVDKVHSETEENVIVNKHLLFLWLVGIQRHQVSVHYGDGSFRGCVKEIIVNLNHCSISLRPLHNALLGESLNYLKLFVPVPNAFGI